MSEQSVNQVETHPRNIHTCPACQRAYSLPAEWPNIACPICQRAPLSPLQESSQSEAVKLILPPGLDIGRLHAQLTQFAKGVPFAVPDFSPQNLAQRLLLVYWPIWLADANLKGEWDASFGYDYQIKSAREKMGGGEWSSETVIKTRVNDEPRKGFIDRRYDNVLAPALRTHTQRLGHLGEYDLHALQPWQPNATAQIAIQEGQLSPNEVEEPVKQAFTKLAALDCRKAADAQHTKSFTFYGEFADMHWNHGLLPVFTSFYEDEQGQRHVVAINGQTGKVYGQRLASMKKAWLLTGILLAIALVLMLIFYFIKMDTYICLAPILLLPWIPVIRASIWNNQEKAKPPLA